MERLSEDDIAAKLDGSAWQREGESIVREEKLTDFRAVIALVNQIAEVAEEANHHPDLLIHGWNGLRITLSTHSEGGLTDNDFSLADRIDELIERTGS